MVRRMTWVGALCVALAGFLESAMGQGRMGGSGTSAFGSGFGSSGFGSSGFGASGFGSSGFGGSGFGSSGFGSSSFGSSGFGGNRLGGGGGFGNSGIGGNPFGGGQTFGMGGYGGGQNFVGRDSGDMASTFTQMGQAGTQFFSQMNRNLARSNREQQPAQNIQNAPQPVRVELEVAFDAPRPSPAVVASNLRSRLGKILTEHDIAQPSVRMEGETAVLGGVAASARERLVLEKLVGLEPGVREIRNEMTVIESPAAAAPPAADN